MPIVSRLAAMTSRAWGQFKATTAGVVGNYLYAWGSNAQSQLGIGLVTATVNRSSPVAVALRKTFTDFDTNSQFVLAVESTGYLWAWGLNASGQLGDGTAVTKSSPVQVGTLTNWSKVSASFRATSIAIKTDGTLWAWGQGAEGRLGDGTTVTKSSPIQVGTLSNWLQVSAGGYAALAVKNDGTLWAWGGNSEGQVGDGTTVAKSSPVQIGTLNTWAYVSGGDQSSYAIKNDGTLWAWGWNFYGQLGQGNTIRRSSPVQIGTLTNWSKISGGEGSFVALKTDGTIWSCGWNQTGQLGDGTTTNKSSPIQIGTLTSWTAVNIRARAAIAKKNDGTLWAWGRNANGQFGINSITNYSSPIQVNTRTDYLVGIIGDSTSLVTTSDGYNWASGLADGLGQVGATNFSTPQVVDLGTRNYASVSGLSTAMIAVSNDNKLWSWGNNASGQLGLGDTLSRSLPAQVGTLSTWKSVNALGTSTASAIGTNNSLWLWGSNTNGELGNNTWGTANQVLSVPTPFTNLQYSDVSYGTGGLYILGGALYAAGNNLNYQLGDGTTVWKSSPVQIGTQTDWSKVASGDSFSLALKTDGTLWAWGNNGAYVNGPSATNYAATDGFSSPVQVALSFEKLTQGSYAQGFCTQLFSGNYLVAWGRNVEGQLGDGTATNRSGAVFIGLDKWNLLADGRNHSLAIKQNGTLWSWGSATSGGLGNNTTTPNVLSPVQIGTLSNYSTISAGNNTSYFINTTGQLWSFGANSNGTLGDGTTVNKSSPIQIGTLTTWSKISAGTNNAYAIKTDGTLWAWGLNGVGQLGDGTTVDKSSPIQIGTLSNWDKVSAGSNYGLAIKTDGTLWAWGQGSNGKLGDGTTNNTSSPIQIGTLTTWSKISAGGGDTSLAVKTDGTLWSWGFNAQGQLADGTTVNKSSPIQIGTLTSWTDVSAMNDRSFFLNSSKEVWAAGRNNGFNTPSPGYNELGIGVPAAIPFPTQVGTLTTWSDISAGYNHVLLKKTNGSLWASGSNQFGKLGIGSTIDNYFPQQVGTLTNWSKIGAAYLSSISTKTDGSIWTWGSGVDGRLGDGTTVDKSSPVQVGTLTNWSEFKVSPWSGSFPVVKTDGTLWTWGYNSNGQLGDGTLIIRSSPVQIGTLNTWAYSFNFGTTSIFSKTDNTAWSTGAGNFLGDGTGVQKSSPVQVLGTGYSGFFAGNSLTPDGSIIAKKTDNTFVSWGKGNDAPSGASKYTPAYIILASVSSPIQLGTLTNWSSNKVKTDGTLWGWGTNGQGQLGFNDLATRISPTQVGTLSNWSFAMTTNFSTFYSAALKTDGTLWTWGANTHGNLGSGSTTSRISPVQVGTLSNWYKLSASGFGNVLSVKTDGTLWAWGYNLSGQLGDGTTTNKSSPIQVGTLTTWTNVFTSSGASYATKTDGTLWAWGLNSSGQVGDGSTINKSSPVQVGTLSNWLSGVNFSGSASGGGLATS